MRVVSGYRHVPACTWPLCLSAFESRRLVESINWDRHVDHGPAWLAPEPDCDCDRR